MDEYEPLIIEVTGINTNTSRDTLDNYFSSSKRGGDITNIEYNKGSGNASITFANAEGRTVFICCSCMDPASGEEHQIVAN
jgi:hypothetical protein